MLPSLPRPGRASSFPPKLGSGCGLPLGHAPSQLVRQRLAARREVQTYRVDAVALARRRRAVGEDMALVRPAARADDLGPDRAITGVADIFEMVGPERLGE